MNNTPPQKKLVMPVALALNLALLAVASGAVFDVSKPPFNANGSDAIDDTAAIQAAINSASNGNGSVFIPAGRYIVSAPLVSSSGPLILTGEGGSSILSFSTSNSTLLYLNYSGNSARFISSQIKDLSLVCSGSGSTAVSVNYPHVDSTHQNHSIVMQRVRVGVERDGSGQMPPGASWSRGVVLRNAWNALISECYLANREGSLLPTGGVAVEVAERSVNLTISQCHFTWWNHGVELSSQSQFAQEGVYISDSFFVPVKFGVYFVNSQCSVERVPVLISMVNCHFDVRSSEFASALYLNPVRDVHVSNCNIGMIGVGDGGVQYGLLLNAESATITGNRFWTGQIGSVAPLTVGVVLLGETNHAFLDARGCVVSGNSISASRGIWLQADTNNNIVRGNSTLGCSQPVLDQGISNSIQ